MTTFIVRYVILLLGLKILFVLDFLNSLAAIEILVCVRVVNTFAGH